MTKVAKDEGRSEGIDATLDTLAREGARRMIAAALEAEVASYIERYRAERGEDPAPEAEDQRQRDERNQPGAPVEAGRIGPLHPQRSGLDNRDAREQHVEREPQRQVGYHADHRRGHSGEAALERRRALQPVHPRREGLLPRLR